MCGDVDMEISRCVDVEMWMSGFVDAWRCGDLELQTLQSYAFG